MENRALEFQVGVCENPFWIRIGDDFALDRGGILGAPNDCLPIIREPDASPALLRRIARTEMDIDSWDQFF